MKVPRSLSPFLSADSCIWVSFAPCHSLLSHFIPKHWQQAESEEEEEAREQSQETVRDKEQRAPAWTWSQLFWRLCYWWEKYSENTAFARIRQWQEREGPWHSNPSRILGNQQCCTKLRGRIVFWSGLMPEYACVCVREHVCTCVWALCVHEHTCTWFCLGKAFWQSQQKLIANKLPLYSAPKTAAFKVVPAGVKSITSCCYTTQSFRMLYLPLHPSAFCLLAKMNSEVLRVCSSTYSGLSTTFQEHYIHSEVAWNNK